MNLTKRVGARIVAPMLAAPLLLWGSQAHAQFSPNNDSQAPFVTWINELDAAGYGVTQGTASAFPTCNDYGSTPNNYIFYLGSCFGNNSEDPYINVDPPLQATSYLPSYLAAFGYPSPTAAVGNNFFQVDDTEAMVTIITLPPLAAYWSFQTYMFERYASNYSDSTPPSGTGSPPAGLDCLPGYNWNPSGTPHSLTADCNYEAFGFIANSTNSAVISSQFGQAFNTVDPEGPDAKAIAIVTTPNSALFSAIQTIFNSTPGLESTQLFAEGMPTVTSLPSTPYFLYTMEGSETNDTFASIIRYSVPQIRAVGNAWSGAPSTNVLSFRVKALATTGFTPYPFSSGNFQTHGSNTNETLNTPPVPTDCELRGFTSYYCDVFEIADDIEGYMSTHSPGMAYTLAPADAEFANGGGTDGPGCIINGINCAGGNEDNSAYRNLNIGSLTTSGPAFFIGVDHASSTGDSPAPTNPINNGRFIGVSAADNGTAPNMNTYNFGVTDLVQANVAAVGFGTTPPPVTLTGSAAAVLASLGITPSAQLAPDLPNLYVAIFYRASSDIVCDQPYCVTPAEIAAGQVPAYVTTISSNSMDSNYIPLTDLILLTERDYLLPPGTSPVTGATLTGANQNDTLTPLVLFSPGS
jgi:hypothetical protein